MEYTLAVSVVQRHDTTDTFEAVIRSFKKARERMTNESITLMFAISRGGSCNPWI